MGAGSLKIVDCDALAQIKLGTSLVVIDAMLADAQNNSAGASLA